MNSLFRSRAPRLGRRALTIEYAVVMMVLVAAFVGLLLTVSALAGESSADYREYTDRKRFIDSAAQVFIDAQGGPASVEPFADNEYSIVFSATSSEFVARESGLGGYVLLRVVLETEDSDGDGVRAVISYVYGLS